MKIGVIAKEGSAQALEAAFKLCQACRDMGVECFIERSCIPFKTRCPWPLFNILEEVPEKLIVIGGDGTLLRTLHKIGDNNSIIMTVRAGRRGFFFDVEPYEAVDRLKDFVEGKYTIVEYERLRTRIRGEELPLALNDVVVLGKSGKIIRLSIHKEDERVFVLDGDGVIASTTAGSTAYSLSAGGPIIDPELNVIVLTPLNPVQLHLRPVVMPLDRVVSIGLRSGSSEAHVIVDGQAYAEAKAGDSVVVSRAYKPVKIARFKMEGYYERLITRIFQYW